MTEWGCMQALIDFEGWRKWRGFAGSQPTATGPVLASPMQVGDGHKPEPSSPHEIGKVSNAKTEGIPEGANGHAHPQRPTDTFSHGISSGSGDSADTLDSTTIPVSTPTTS